jgi:hypothetical protein
VCFFKISYPKKELIIQGLHENECCVVLISRLKSNVKCNCLIVSKVLPILIVDFLPPSEILNRVIAEFMSPMQTSPELMAPVVAQASFLSETKCFVLYCYWRTYAFLNRFSKKPVDELGRLPK